MFDKELKLLGFVTDNELFNKVSCNKKFRVTLIDF